MEAQLAQVLAAQQSSQAALLAALAARPAPAPAPPAPAALLLQAAQQARCCRRPSSHDKRALSSVLRGLAKRSLVPCPAESCPLPSSGTGACQARQLHQGVSLYVSLAQHAQGILADIQRALLTSAESRAGARAGGQPRDGGQATAPQAIGGGAAAHGGRGPPAGCTWRCRRRWCARGAPAAAAAPARMSGEASMPVVLRVVFLVCLLFLSVRERHTMQMRLQP